MAVRILTGDDNYQVMYCSTTMTAFGQVHTEEGFDLNDFLEWLDADPRLFTDEDLNNKYWDWLAYEKQKASDIDDL